MVDKREGGHRFISMRVKDGPCSVPGSTTMPCSECGEDIWVSPSARYEAPWRAAFCVECAGGRSALMDALMSGEASPTEAQLAEVPESVRALVEAIVDFRDSLRGGVPDEEDDDEEVA